MYRWILSLSHITLQITATIGAESSTPSTLTSQRGTTTTTVLSKNISSIITFVKLLSAKQLYRKKTNTNTYADSKGLWSLWRLLGLLWHFWYAVTLTVIALR